MSAVTSNLDPKLVQEAVALGVDVDAAAEAGLRDALRRARGEAWRNENAQAMAAWSDWIDRHGLPLERWRQF